MLDFLCFFFLSFIFLPFFEFHQLRMRDLEKSYFDPEQYDIKLDFMLSFQFSKKELKGAYWISSNIAIAILDFTLLLPL